MKGRLSSTALRAIAWAVFVLVIAWPTLALIGRCMTQGALPAGGFTPGPRQWTLLSRTLGISAAATVLCLVLSLPAAYVLGRAGGSGWVRGRMLAPATARKRVREGILAPATARKRVREGILAPAILAQTILAPVRVLAPAILPALLVMLLLTPPMVCVFGWQRILPADFNPYARCVGAWALWAWPIPAMFLAAGWSRAARAPHEAATLVASPWSAFLRVALPVLVRSIALGGLIVFVLFFGDYGVPHACGLSVYATEVLGWAQESGRTIDVLAPALPGVAVVGVAVGLVLWIGSRLEGGANDGSGPPRESWSGGAAAPDGATVRHRSSIADRGTTVALWATTALFVVSWLLPIGWLAIKLGSRAAYARAIAVYGVDLACSLGVGVVSGLMVVVMGLGLSGGSRGSRLALCWSILLGALPGGLIGVALIAAYNNGVTYWVYDGWTIMAMSYAGRFAWIGFIAGLLVAGRRGSPLAAQARTDGADDASVLARVQVPLHFGTLLAAVAVVTALALADVAASTLVRVPSYNPIAHVLIEKYHRFEDDMLVSLSLWLVAAVVPAAGLLAWVRKRRAR